jgi:SagB-type dehydrogenase family enzyme
LELRRPGFDGRIAGATLQPADLTACNAIVTIVGIPARTMAKYGQRGYRFMLFDAGHLAQNLCLVACACKVGALTIGGFYDFKLAAALALAPGEWPLYLVALGAIGVAETSP